MIKFQPTWILILVSLIISMALSSCGNTSTQSDSTNQSAQPTPTAPSSSIPSPSVPKIPAVDLGAGDTELEACSENSGNCYTLNADVSDGKVETIHFDNGGYLHIDGGELDASGDGEGDSMNSNGESDHWTFHCESCSASDSGSEDSSPEGTSDQASDNE